MPLDLSQAPISDWQFKELISPTQTPAIGEILTLSVPAWLPERRIYLYTEAKLSAAAAYQFYMRVRAFLGGMPKGDFPASICDFTGQTPNQSVPCLFNAGGSPVGDSLVLRLAQPFDATVPAVVVQPMRINVQIDRLVLQVDAFAGATATGFRVYLGVLSTLY